MSWANLTALLSGPGGVTLGIAVITSVITFTARSLIRHFFDSGLEKHKVSLKAAHDAELTRLKADLQRTAFEHQTRFGRLHALRAEAICTTFQRLVAVKQACANLSSPGGPVDDHGIKQLATEATQQFTDCWDYFEKHSLFFDQGVREDIEKLKNEVIKLIIDRTGWMGVDTTHDPSAVRGRTESWLSAIERQSKSIPPILNKIRDEFSEALGMPGDDAAG